MNTELFASTFAKSTNHSETLVNSAPTVKSHSMKANEAVQIYFDRAADQLQLAPSMRKLLKIAKREVTVEVPIELDDGSIETFVGYRVQHKARPACQSLKI